MRSVGALASGALGGFVGAALAHVFVTLANRAGGELWLKGPYGPPFFDVCLYMGVLLAGVGAGALRRPRPAVLGLVLPLVVMALPLWALTHWARWGMDAGGPPTNGWYYTVGVLYVVATWGTMAGLGALGAPARRWLGALLACAGAFAGYLLLSLILKLAPSYAAMVWSPTGWVPSAVNLLDGLLTGAGLSLGIYFARRTYEKSVRA